MQAKYRDQFIWSDDKYIYYVIKETIITSSYRRAEESAHSYI